MLDFQHDILPLKNIIFRTALRIVLNREEAEDIVQDILLKLWERRRELERVENLEAFALTMTRNLAIDRKEKMDNRHVTLDQRTHDQTDEESPNADSLLMAQEKDRFIANAINSLPKKQRCILQLRDIEGKTYKEIATMLNITESDVKVSLFRARNEIKEKITQKKLLFL
ncbi:MAG: RNA polymerase sigma factor [Bacteroidaceae bacterium]|nr:RNA polymerase sigma factor [Bacteroidaceae bacterium]